VGDPDNEPTTVGLASGGNDRRGGGDARTRSLVSRRETFRMEANRHATARNGSTAS
jgi:hypothetical protein